MHSFEHLHVDLNKTLPLNTETTLEMHVLKNAPSRKLTFVHVKGRGNLKRDRALEFMLASHFPYIVDCDLRFLYNGDTLDIL